MSLVNIGNLEPARQSRILERAALASASLCRALSLAFRAPGEDLAAELRALAASLAEPERGRVLALAERVTPDHEVDYHRVLGAGGSCPCAESDHLPWRTIGGKGAILGDVAAYYRAFAYHPEVEERDSPDRLSIELGFLGWLHLKEAFALSEGRAADARVCRDARESFTEEHLATWVDVLVDRLEASEGETFFGEAARVLRASLAFEPRAPVSPARGPDAVAFHGVPLDELSGAPLVPGLCESTTERGDDDMFDQFTSEDRPVTFGLSGEHRIIERELEQARLAAVRGDLARLRATLRFFDTQMTLHRRKEEEVLFPVLSRVPALADGPVRVMLLEHQEERGLLDALRRALGDPEGPEPTREARRVVEELVTLLGGHILKEDQVLYRLAEEVLEDDQAIELRRAFDEIGYVR